MGSKSPKITVITPTYNRADLIIETIKSVLTQDYKEFEYLILDDGSTDNTEEIVKPFLKDKRVTYLKHKNAGEAETVNWGWSLAKGEYFTQVNSDDPILAGLFSEMVKILDHKTDTVLAYPDFYFIDENGKRIKKIRNPDWNFTNALRQFACYAASPGTFIRKSSFHDWKTIRNKKYKYINDINMYWNMAIKGNFIHVNKTLATWRDHKGGITANRDKSIPELKMWFNEYFSKKELPQSIIDIKENVKYSLYTHYIRLLMDSHGFLKYIKIAYYEIVRLLIRLRIRFAI